MTPLLSMLGILLIVIVFLAWGASSDNRKGPQAKKG